jgi:hypothetical protein
MSKTPAELQIENLKRMKALQAEMTGALPAKKPRDLTGEQNTGVAAPLAGKPPMPGGGLLVTELFEDDDTAVAQPNVLALEMPPVAKKKSVKKVQGCTKIQVDSRLYKRLKAKWRLERRFASEKEYWDWALNYLLQASSSAQFNNNDYKKADRNTL